MQEDIDETLPQVSDIQNITPQPASLTELPSESPRLDTVHIYLVGLLNTSGSSSTFYYHPLFYLVELIPAVSYIILSH